MKWLIRIIGTQGVHSLHKSHKKMLLLIISALLVFTLLVGCQNKQKEAPKVLTIEEFKDNVTKKFNVVEKVEVSEKDKYVTIDMYFKTEPPKEVTGVLRYETLTYYEPNNNTEKYTGLTINYYDDNNVLVEEIKYKNKKWL